MLKPLPIGEQTFRKLIEGGYLYVDKTRLIYEMIRYPSGVYFLSRPRRFGKSLLISTLEEIFLGNKALFQGLWLYTSDYAWEAVNWKLIFRPISTVLPSAKGSSAVTAAASRACVAAGWGRWMMPETRSKRTS